MLLQLRLVILGLLHLFFSQVDTAYSICDTITVTTIYDNEGQIFLDLVKLQDAGRVSATYQNQLADVQTVPDPLELQRTSTKPTALIECTRVLRCANLCEDCVIALTVHNVSLSRHEYLIVYDGDSTTHQRVMNLGSSASTIHNSVTPHIIYGSNPWLTLQFTTDDFNRAAASGLHADGDAAPSPSTFDISWQTIRRTDASLTPNFGKHAYIVLNDGDDRGTPTRTHVEVPTRSKL